MPGTLLPPVLRRVVAAESDEPKAQETVPTANNQTLDAPASSPRIAPSKDSDPAQAGGTNEDEPLKNADAAGDGSSTRAAPPPLRTGFSWSVYAQAGARLRKRSRMMISPSSSWRVAWDLVSGIWLLYIAVVL